MFGRLFLIYIFILLQSCSNTSIGEKLENSFEITDNQTNSGNNMNIKNNINEMKQIKSNKNNIKKNTNNQFNNITENSKLVKDNLSQKTNKSIKKVIFNPQPYRIILKLSGANPSAPAETVTKALRKAGVQFEVEKIERFDEESSLKKTSLKR